MGKVGAIDKPRCHVEVEEMRFVYFRAPNYCGYSFPNAHKLYNREQMGQIILWQASTQYNHKRCFGRLHEFSR